MPEPPTDEEAPDPVVAWFDEYLAPLVTDSSLWPVFSSVTLSVIVLLSVLLVFAWRDHNPLGWVGVGLLVLLTFDVIRREIAERRRPGTMFVVAVVLWTLAAVLGTLTTHYGLF